ncbi:hypothetical protein KO516_14530 [Citreicella sp. C3M06]|uniref:hypothetical protein n=1 Tax=Citreicella sp. C3M06 TaxID=2841564 RepID=UPI001C081B50|nr:hypothetical protein [Citreicella sp. C3M06]MBU2962003.1 hypothetical protein [Citreicella sp. C3M06]
MARPARIRRSTIILGPTAEMVSPFFSMLELGDLFLQNCDLGKISALLAIARERLGWLAPSLHGKPRLDPTLLLMTLAAR